MSNNEKTPHAQNSRRIKTQASSETLRILSNFENRPIHESDFFWEESGRPFFPGKDTDFNISHSSFLIAVSYASGKNIRTGCDIEKIRDRKSADEIAKDYFSESENIYLYEDSGFNLTRFYEIWTLKECFIKLRGLSIFDMAKVPSFIQDNNFLFYSDSSLPVTFRLYNIQNENNENYMMACAFEGAALNQPEIRIFSSSLCCKMTAEIKGKVKYI